MAYYGPESRVLPATKAEIPQEAMFNSLEISQESEGNDNSVDTVADDVHEDRKSVV